MASTNRFVIGIEQEVEVGMERLVIAERRIRQNERLEEPGRVREMPLRRTGVGHRLDLHVLRGEWLTRRFNGGARLLIAGEQVDTHAMLVKLHWRAERREPPGKDITR